MEDIVIATDPEGGSAVLTTHSPMSHYGCPVLQITAEDVDGDFGPADLIHDDAHERIYPAANVVAGWAMKPERSVLEVKAARMYLAQWPEGPQV